MGTFLNGIKTKFSKIDELKHRIHQSDFDYIELTEHAASEELSLNIRTSKLITYSTPIEYATKYFSVTEKRFYNTFFYHLFWTTFDEDDEIFIDINKYSQNDFNDDLGWLKIDKEAYWKAFEVHTLKNIISDFNNVDFKLIQKGYEKARLKFEQEFIGQSDFNSERYQQETKEIFIAFITITSEMIELYKSCVKENKDLILEFM